MLKKRCNGCDRKIERKFNYCPWCGHSFKAEKEEDFGMLGSDDEIKIPTQTNLPFGLDKVFNSLVKQIEKELSVQQNSKPHGFKIQISTGMPNAKIINPNNNMINVEESLPELSKEEKGRRINLKRVEAKSIVRRLPEGIFYEIETPGVKSKKDVVITKLEESLEIKAYSKDKCYVKTIPLKVEIVSYVVKDDKIFLRLKN